MKKLIHVFLFGVAISAGSSDATVVTNAPTSQIVTCREGVDVAGLVKEYGLTPTFIYTPMLNGFAAPIAAGTIQKLKADSRVLAVEWDSPVELCDQTNSTGFARMGIAYFPVAHINGANEPLNDGTAILNKELA